jgi:hypothetical protein
MMHSGRQLLGKTACEALSIVAKSGCGSWGALLAWPDLGRLAERLSKRAHRPKRDHLVKHQSTQGAPVVARGTQNLRSMTKIFINWAVHKRAVYSMKRATGMKNSQKKI